LKPFITLLYIWKVEELQRKFIDDLQNIVRDLSLDLRTEVLVNDLVLRGFSITDFFVRPVGLFRRRFDRDISGIEYSELQDENPALILSLNREGLYDALPENVFHYPPNRKPKAFKEVSQMVAEVKQRVKEEETARNFFVAYENEFLRQRLANEWQERRLFDTITYSMDDEQMLGYLDLPSILSKRQKGILFYLYPIIHRIRADINMMNAAYTAILRDDVEISQVQDISPGQIDFNGNNSTLGENRLASSFVIGQRSPEYFEVFQFKVILEDISKIVLYVEGGQNRNILLQLHRYFLPVHIESTIELNVPAHP